MSLTLEAKAPPLCTDSSGAIRIGETRILLELVIRTFQDGATLETIIQRYSSLSLGDVDSVIGYYLHHEVT
jgi:uncharacterized protein (DUF433 family)